MICSHCKHQNPIGNKFCRECGAAFPPSNNPLEAEDSLQADVERRSERVAGLLSAALTLSEQKRYDQALPIAEEAALLLPNSTAALSLLSTLLQQTGNTPRAIAVMERVVALNPESPSDRKKLDDLRHASRSPEPAGASAGSASSQVVAKPVRKPHWAPFVIGGAAFACVLGFGMSMMNNHRSTSQQTTPLAVATASPVTGASAAPPPVTGAASQPSAADIAAAIAKTAQSIQKDSASDAGRADPFTAAGRSNAAAGGSASSLPALRINAGHSNNSASGDSSASSGESAGTSGTLPPIIAVPPPATNAYGATQSGQNDGYASVNRIPAAPPTGGGDASVSSTPAPYIKITVGGTADSGAGRAAGESPSAGAAAGGDADALSRARQLQSGGHYSDAIAAYQQAIAGGSGSAEAHQGMAQSYERLGNDNAARNHYIDALHAYESQVSSGRNVSAAQRGVASCKAALEVLGGG